MALLSIASVLLALKIPKSEINDFNAKLRCIDSGGRLTLVAAVFCLLLGLDWGGNISWCDPLTASYVAASALLFPGLIFCHIKCTSQASCSHWCG